MKRGVTHVILTQAGNSVQSRLFSSVKSEPKNEPILGKMNMTWFISEMDRAAEILLNFCADDELLGIIQIAKKHNKLPPEYQLRKIGSFTSYGFEFRSANLKYNRDKEPIIRIFSGFGIITITSKKYMVNRSKITPKLKILIEAYQECLKNIEAALKA